MLRLRCVAAAIALLVAVALLALPSNGATAQEPLVMAFEQPASGTVALQPGINEVGWLTESADPQALFDEIPQLETIWTWHTLDQRWQAAARDVPSNLWTLYRLVPGMGLRLQIAGNAPVNWQRSLVPASGKVELQPGNNFVAWAGRDGWDVNQLAKGIGRQLQEIHRRNPSTGQHDTIWPVAEGAEPATVARGAALWVKMPRSIVWLQPTDIMMRLVFLGGVPENVQVTVRRSLRNTLDYFAAQHGIQADTMERAIYMSMEQDALEQRLKAEGILKIGQDISPVWLRGAWAGDRVIGINATYHIEYPAGLQGLLTHEYFHWVQRDLRNRDDHHDHEGLWAKEGSANYASWDQEVASGKRTWPEIASAQQWYIHNTPRLSSTERGNDQFEYILGSRALLRLVEQSRPSAWADFYRELAPTRIGSANQWQSILPWRDVFASAFDIELDAFYVAFDQWQADGVERSGSRPADDALNGLARIEGHVVRADGSPVAGYFVTAGEITLAITGERIGFHEGRRAETDADGNFALIIPNDRQYILNIHLDDEQNCNIYYSEESIAYTPEDAGLLAVNSGTLRNVRFTIADGVCGHELHGSVRRLDGKPLAGIRVNIAPVDGFPSQRTFSRHWTRTDSTGAFNVTVHQQIHQQSESGIYHLSASITDGCTVFLGVGGGVTASWRDAELIDLSAADAHRNFRISESWCRHTISGQLLDSNDQPLAGIWIDADSDDGGGGGTTDDEGVFTLTVPQDGTYRLGIALTANCKVYLTGDGITADWHTATTVRVAGEDVRRNIRIPVGWCEHTINGRLFDSNDQPLADILIDADSDNGRGGGFTGYDGAFTLVVPQAGDYRIDISLSQGCSVYFVRDGVVTADRDAAATVQVADRDVHIDIRVPDGWCEHSISGRLLDSDGQPLAGIGIFADSDGVSASDRVANDGSFTITVPQDGAYRLAIWMGFDCGDVYFASGGSVTTDWNAAATVRVAGRDIRIGDIRIPAAVCDG